MPKSDSAPLSPDALRSLEAEVRRERGRDPLIGPKLGSEMVLETLLCELRAARGVHAETLLTVAGGLIGQSTQACLLAEAHREGQGGIPGVQVVRCRSGQSYLVGERLNRRLIEGLDSPWSLLGEAARQEGCDDLPPGPQMLLESIERMGSEGFALAPDGQATLWRQLGPLCGSCCQEPAEWPLLCSLVAVRALRLVKPLVKPGVAFRLAMESAIDAARVPLNGRGSADKGKSWCESPPLD